ncbi:MAG: alpha/beta hydrolase [Acidobacteria bacterium]|nr:alpha/beta hydrolase [Acidobacteriota bacterium]
MPRVPKFVGWPLLAAWTYGVLSFLANRAAYYPLKFPQGFWKIQQHLGAQDLWLRAADGVRLHAWWIPAPEARVATLYLHGNGGNLTFRADAMQAIPSAGSSLLMLDYRGYGRSQGSPSEKGLYADAEAGYQHLLAAGYAPERIVVYGESLGTAVAVDLAARHKVAGVVLQAPFTSARDVAWRVLPLLGPMLVWGFDSKRKIPGIGVPLLILHGDRDEVIAFDLGRALFAAAREPKWFWTVRGAGHNDLIEVAGAEYAQRLREFYGRL